MTIKPSIGLIVLRTANMEEALNFYRALGLEFVQEQHGTGPVHYSCDLDVMVMEIYPGKPGTAPDRRNGGATMLGFQVSSVDAALAAVQEIGATVFTPPQTSAWGRRAVVTDPDDRAIELTEPIT